MEYNTNIKIHKSFKEDVNRLLTRYKTQDRLRHFADFNMKILSETNIHTDSFRYAYAYIICKQAYTELNDSAKLTELENSVNERALYQKEHNITFKRGKVFMNNTNRANTRNKEVKSNSINIPLDTSSLLRGAHK